jgi:hypothetical protein
MRLYSFIFCGLIPLFFMAGCGSTPNPINSLRNNFDTLYHGNGLGAWEFTGAGNFTEENGTLRSNGGLGLLWYPNNRYSDFELILEWKANSPSADSGVFVRVANVPDVPRIAIESGYEIQINDKNNNPLNQTGAILGYASPSHVPVKPTGEWNEMKVIARGYEYNVWINNEHVCTFYSRKTMTGYIALQNHDENSSVWFRNIRIRDL